MNFNEARKRILDVLVGVELLSAEKRQCLLEGPTADIQIAELGIDSIKIVDLCVGLEEQIGREISVEELIENPTLNKLADHFIKEHV